MVVFAYRMAFGWDLLGFKNQSVGFFRGRKKNCWSRLPTYGKVIMFVGSSSGSIVRGCACIHVEVCLSEAVPVPRSRLIRFNNIDIDRGSVRPVACPESDPRC